MDINIIKEQIKKQKKHLSNFATKDEEALRFKKEVEDIRTPFFRDIDRIIYSLSYNRYSDKTQVFTFKENDHISKRMIHVQLVSKVARTIGRALSLNEDLIEAIALGHDLGHVPFGHVGEYILNDLSLEHNAGYFSHNIQSVRTLMNIEDNGTGKNITFQVLDGIMCHNGELELEKYEPRQKTKEDFLKEYNSVYQDINNNKKLIPSTLEGCVVRISDIIAYLGRDIEDAIRLNYLKKEQLPEEIINTLGDDNRQIINNFITDVISNSFQKPYISMSKEKFSALKALKKFNYDNIYANANTKEEHELYKDVFRTVFEYNLENFNKENTKMHQEFINHMSKGYLKENKPVRIVIDYIAGMTDDYIMNHYQEIRSIYEKK